MYAAMRRYYDWVGMAANVVAHVRQCDSCARQRVRPLASRAPLTLFPATVPFQDVAVDLYGPLERTAAGNENILVITDRFTKLVRAIPMGSVKAVDCAFVVLDSWVAVYGPQTGCCRMAARSSRPTFGARFCNLLSIESKLTTPSHPQTNCQTERFSRTMHTILNHYVAEHPRSWDQLAAGGPDARLQQPTPPQHRGCPPGAREPHGGVELGAQEHPPPRGVPGDGPAGHGGREESTSGLAHPAGPAHPPATAYLTRHPGTLQTRPRQAAHAAGGTHGGGRIRLAAEPCQRGRPWRQVGPRRPGPVPGGGGPGADGRPVRRQGAPPGEYHALGSSGRGAYPARGAGPPRPADRPGRSTGRKRTGNATPWTASRIMPPSRMVHCG